MVNAHYSYAAITRTVNRLWMAKPAITAFSR